MTTDTNTIERRTGEESRNSKFTYVTTQDTYNCNNMKRTSIKTPLFSCVIASANPTSRLACSNRARRETTLMFKEAYSSKHINFNNNKTMNKMTLTKGCNT